MNENTRTQTPAFKGLSRNAQWLYFVAMNEGPRRCGIVDVWPKRISQIAADTTEEDVTAAAVELDRAGIVHFDEDTDEMLLPGYLTEVTPVSNKRMLIAVVNSVHGVASMKLIALVVGELQKLRDRTQSAGAWDDPRVAKFLARPALDPSDVAGGAGQ